MTFALAGTGRGGSSPSTVHTKGCRFIKNVPFHRKVLLEGRFIIETEGILDIESIIDEIGELTSFNVCVELKQKQNGSGYSGDLSNYQSVSFYSNIVEGSCNNSHDSERKTNFEEANAYTVEGKTLTIDGNQITITLTFEMIRGSYYANYEIIMKVWVNCDSNYYAEDNLKFTYAKLLPDFID